MELTIATGIEDPLEKMLDWAIGRAVALASANGVSVCYYHLPELGVEKHRELVNPTSLITPDTLSRLFLDNVETIKAIGYQAIKAELLEMQLKHNMPHRVIIYSPATQYNIAVCSEFPEIALGMLEPDRFVTFLRQPEAILDSYLKRLETLQPGDVDKRRHQQWLESKGGEMDVYKKELLRDMVFWQGREAARASKWAKAYGKQDAKHICYLLENQSSPALVWQALTGDNL